ncbi:uncharacterized protein [Mytilus edulis]|uniref:uncharacterized protein n=1 Tax=Mytilus edulis TaxID=6550 RepID=UPI0039F0E049
MYHKNPTTGESTNFERQMKKAKRLCNEGFIRDIEYNPINQGSEHNYFRSKCMPSMRQIVQVGDTGNTAKYYSLHISIIKVTGLIVSAFCNCKAGGAGLCAHVGSLLYTLVKTKDACTSNACGWDRPRSLQRKPSPNRVCDIKFVKTEKEQKAEKIKPYPGVYQAGPCREEGNLFLHDILDGLKDVYPECVLYQTLRPEHANIDTFLELFQTNFSYMDNIIIKSAECLNVFEAFVNSLTVTSKISENLEKATRGQHFNVNWKKARSVLITASVMGEVVKRKKLEPDNLVKKLCGYITIPDAVKSLQYGRKNEAVAIGDYTRSHLKTCDDVRIESCGLLVNPTYPYLGASIDGLVVCSKCGTGIVEVKCPYGSDANDKPWRNMLPIECGKDKKFFCSERDSNLVLDENHNYMYQVQGQLALYELDWADFVVWTKKGINVQILTYNGLLINCYLYGELSHWHSHHIFLYLKNKFFANSLG